MLRAVLDANVLVSALIQPGGTPGRIVEQWLGEKPFELITSAAILGEVRRALRCPRVRKFLKLSQREIEAVFAVVEAAADIVEGAATIDAPVIDSADRRVVAAAVDGDADYLVTGDQRLLALRRYAACRIVRPASFLSLIE